MVSLASSDNFVTRLFGREPNDLATVAARVALGRDRLCLYQLTKLQLLDSTRFRLFSNSRLAWKKPSNRTSTRFYHSRHEKLNGAVFSSPPV
jgi:hypothetical protein